MEYDPELETAITYAMLEVERDLSLATNSLVNATPLTDINEEVTGRKLEVWLDPHFLANVPKKHLKHSKELILRKQLAVTISQLLKTTELQEKTNALLFNTLDLLLEQCIKLQTQTVLLGTPT